MRNYKQDEFLLDILDINWPETILVENNDANYSFDRFYNTLNRIIDKHIPLRKVTKK